MASPFALTLDKAASQASLYFYVWTVQGSRSVAQKQMGTTQLTFSGANDTEVLVKINAHEGYLVTIGKPVHR